MVIASEQAAHWFLCVVFFVADFFPILFFCLGLPPPGAYLLMNGFDLIACLELNLLWFLSRIFSVAASPEGPSVFFPDHPHTP